MFSGSWIELSKSALESNLRLVRNLLGEQTRLSAVIKGNAYGHGLTQMTAMLQEQGVDHFSVFNSEEAYIAHDHLREGSQLLIMGDVEDDALAWAIQTGVEFFVFDERRLQNTIELAGQIGKRARVHLEVETGMNRTGLPLSSLTSVAGLIRGHPDLVEVTGLCTHFAGAESIANFHRIQTQIRKYRKSLELCHKLEIPPRIRHTCCSAGILRYPKMALDLARVGILLYGHWPSNETMIESRTRKKWTEDPLKRILSWKSRLMSIKTVKAGEFIGYGMGFQARNDMTVGVIPVGYGYGYSRSLSNQGQVLIRGHRAPVVGTVNMNAFTVDISSIPDAREGDTVVIIGSDRGEAVSVSSFSELSNQLNYELLTRLPASIPRQIVK